MLNRAGWWAVGILLAAAAYELALALGAGSLGPEPGDDVAGSTVVQVIALLTMLAAGVLAAAYTVRPRRAAALLAPAAAAFLVTFYFTYDPYYAPQLYRYSEGNIAWPWIAVAAGAGLAVGGVTRLLPRLGAAASSIMVFVVFVMTIAAGDGH
ncbi:MAG TPA: hypothetical protein VGK69_12745 [Gaiellaceae bacterium]